MIVDFVLHGVFLILQFILSPLANANDASISPSITDAIQTASAFINGIKEASPVDTLYAVLGLLLAFELVFFLTKGILFGIKRIPFVG